MKLATGGVAPIPEMLQNEVNVSIGTDGCTTNNSLDMFGEMKTLSLLQKASRWDPTSAVTAGAGLRHAGGAKALGLSDQIGSIEVGKRADLVILDGRFTRPEADDAREHRLQHRLFGRQGRREDGPLRRKDRHAGPGGHDLDEEKVLDESEGAIRALLILGRNERPDHPNQDRPDIRTDE